MNESYLCCPACSQGLKGMRRTRLWHLSLCWFLLALCLLCGQAVKRAPSSKPLKSTTQPSKPRINKTSPSTGGVSKVSKGSSCPAETPPPARKEPLKGDLTVNIRLKDGSLHPLPVNTTAGMLGFRQQLLSAGLVGHAAEPLRLQRFQDGARISVPLNSTSELQGDDLIIIESSLSSQVPSASRRWRPSEADFVPYPELQWKGKAVTGRAGRRTRTFDDINLYKVSAQPNASVSLLKLDSLSIRSFIDRLSTPNHTRVALLFGRVNTTTLEVRAEALFEPPQPGQQEEEEGDDEKKKRRPCYDDAALYGPEAVRATKLAAMLGLVPVGWVVGNGGGGGKHLTAQDVVVGSKLQLEAMKREGREAGGSFVLVLVNTHSRGGGGGKKGGGGDTSVEAYQVSKQAVQMLSDGLLDWTMDRNKLQKDKVPVTSEVFINGDGVKEVDSAFFTVPVAIATHRGPMRFASGPLASSKDLRSLISDEGRIDPRRLPSVLSDFHVLLLLNRYLKNEELQKVCRALETVGARKGAAGKKGGKKGRSASTSVPPAIAALVPLLEALCDDE